MATQTPLLLVDNVWDAVRIYPGAIVDAVSEVAGRESFRVGDYRRDRTWWQPTSDGGGSDTWVRVHLLAARSVDFVFLDRGHNLAGKSIFLEGGTDGVAWPTSVQLNVPANGVVGGTPASPAMAATEEAAAWTIIPATTARTWWRLRIPYASGFVPQVTGILAGLKTQMLGYARIFDEDQGERTQPTEMSKAGYRASDTVYAWRTAELSVGLIGSAEYDSTFRTLRSLLFEKDQPAVLFMDYGTYPERGWMFQYEGTRWGMPKTRVYRDATIPLREVGQRLS